MVKVPRTHEQTEALVNAQYEYGFSEGRKAGIAYEQARLALDKQASFIKLINAVGQTLDTQARLVQGLASALDNAGGLR